MLLLLLGFLTLSDGCFGTMEFSDCPDIIIDWEWNVIIPTGPFIFFRGLGEKPPSIELDDGKFYRKTLYLMVKTMVSCRFSQQNQYIEPSSFVLFPGMDFRICPARHLEDDTGCFVSSYDPNEHPMNMNSN